MPEEPEAPDQGIGPPSEDSGKETPAPAPLFGPEDGGTPVPPEEGPETPTEGPAEPFDWSKVDFRRNKAEEVPEEHRPAFERLQKQFKDVQGDSSRRLEDVQRREREVEQREREAQRLQSEALDIQKRVSLPQTPREVQQAQDDIERILNDPNTDQDTRNAVLLMQRIADRKYEALEKKVQPLLDEYPKLRDSVQTLSNKEVEAANNNLRLQLEEAIALYDRGDIDQHSEAIRRLLGLDDNNRPVSKPLVNPATGKPHTVTSAYELMAGITGQKAAAARAEDSAIREGAKRKAASPNSVASPPSTALTESEARAQVKNLGFGA